MFDFRNFATPVFSFCMSFESGAIYTADLGSKTARQIDCHGFHMKTVLLTDPDELCYREKDVTSEVQ